MPGHSVLEICVESVEHALAAERGGADRIELCSDLPSGGITPSAGLMQTARRHVSVSIHVLIRPRAGNFFYSGIEIESMRDDIEAAKQTGVDGLVLGILDENNRVDIENTKTLVDLARPLPVTFHRAFDLAKDRIAALEDVIGTGAARILTSGGKERATDALLTLTRLVQAAQSRIQIMPCGGIDSSNVLRIVRTTAAREIHTSVGMSRLRSISERTRVQHNVDSLRRFDSLERKVAKLVRQLKSLSEKS
jgi:copper homeostasis protein